MESFVQFGAGNIGRSFIGRLFADAGYSVGFVDVDKRLVGLLNEKGAYTVVVKQNGKADTPLTVKGVRGVDGTDRDAVVAALFDASCAATSVGQRALKAVLPTIAAGIAKRAAAGKPALDIIIAENIRNGSVLFREELKAALPAGFDLDRHVGLVETSIGKMVPLMPKAALEEDPLQLFAEPYDTLIVDAKGFRNPLPPLKGLKPVDDVLAYVDRKLFMHNMSHAAVAYLGWRADRSVRFLWEALEVPGVRQAAEAALAQSAAALAAAYPAALSPGDLAAHAQDLLSRYANRALGDTVYRVGRDVPRKIAKDDRLVGACLLAAKKGLPFDRIAAAAGAALSFDAADEAGKRSPADEEFLAALATEGAAAAFARASGLDRSDKAQAAVLEACLSGAGK